MNPRPALALAALATVLAAQSAQAAGAPNPAFQAVLDCRKVTDPTQRLACFDAAAAKMGEAETKGEIVVIDRAQATAAHKESFGLHLPSLDFVSKALKPEEVDSVDGVVKAAKADINGKWAFVLEDGAHWQQISGNLRFPPKAGSKVKIRKASLGSYIMNVDGQPAIKVHRNE